MGVCLVKMAAKIWILSKILSVNAYKSLLLYSQNLNGKIVVLLKCLQFKVYLTLNGPKVFKQLKWILLDTFLFPNSILLFKMAAENL